MQYVPPLGEANPNASYKDRNTAAGQPGSRVPAPAVEHVMREVVAVIVDAGITPSGEDLTQLLQAIDLKISAITGEGDGALFVLMEALRSRNPIFPEVVSADGSFNLSVPALGTVRIPAGIQIVHRGCFSDTTVQQDLATELRNVLDSGYNPSALPEDSVTFDTGYDDMLTHRIVTNASNVAAITNLRNKDRLMVHAGVQATNFVEANGANSRADFALTLNWARTPRTRSYSMTAVAATDGVVADRDIVMYSNYPGVQALEIPATRYRVAYTLLYDYTYALTAAINAQA
jgi:hypothetical protein